MILAVFLVLCWMCEGALPYYLNFVPPNPFPSWPHRIPYYPRNHGYSPQTYQIYADFPYEIIDAAAAVLEGKTTICGGWDKTNLKLTKKCQQYDQVR